MRNQHIVLFILLSLMAGSGLAAQTLDWDAVRAIRQGTLILVRTQQEARCYYHDATSDELTCKLLQEAAVSLGKPNSTLVFNRAIVREVRIIPIDKSKGFLDMLLAFGGGGGLDANGRPTTVVGGKIGGTFTLDLQYDRLQGNNGFSTGGSAVVPLFRFPGPMQNPRKKYIKVYAEPGIGYRAGGGAFGFYSSAQMLVMLVSDQRWEKPMPYIEYQHRFPFDSPLQGDNRLSISVLIAFCRVCDEQGF